MGQADGRPGDGDETLLTSHSAAGGQAHEPPAARLSDILLLLARDDSRERIAVADLLALLQDRAFGALMFIFALPNVLPTPPGTSAVLGAPLVFLTAQLALGMRPWLPKLIAERSMARKDFAAVIERAVPWLVRAERLLAPRLGVFTRPPAEYAVGIVCFVLAVVLTLPIPLGNMLPALAICMMALGILERDGLWILGGLVATALSLVVVSGVLYALFKTAMFIILNAFG
ncbi:exopolysaccharide biosynthesis protein [Ancylobacter terrae]|uniref:exopolysaccharide biosynthesis protein n=1 Tax=Ancylobacter sp. sgz301288 TaxID=3342077 RepID=UPI00385A2A3E